MIKRAKDYRQQEEHEANWALKVGELTTIQSHIDNIASKATSFNDEWVEIKSKVLLMMDEQLKEYVSSVNNSPH